MHILSLSEFLPDTMQWFRKRRNSNVRWKEQQTYKAEFMKYFILSVGLWV